MNFYVALWQALFFTLFFFCLFLCLCLRFFFCLDSVVFELVWQAASEDISLAQADGIVNPANSRLQNAGFAAAAIEKAGGEAFRLVWVLVHTLNMAKTHKLKQT